jgi:hypothetical protein
MGQRRTIPIVVWAARVSRRRGRPCRCGATSVGRPCARAPSVDAVARRPRSPTRDPCALDRSRSRGGAPGRRGRTTWTAMLHRPWSGLRTGVYVPFRPVGSPKRTRRPGRTRWIWCVRSDSISSAAHATNCPIPADPTGLVAYFSGYSADRHVEPTAACWELLIRSNALSHVWAEGGRGAPTLEGSRRQRSNITHEGEVSFRLAVRGLLETDAT